MSAGVAGDTRRWWRRLFLGQFVLLWAVLSAGGSAWAQGDTYGFNQEVFRGGTIQRIRVDGTQRIEPETVASYMIVRAGDPFEPETIDISLKRLFATSLFSDVTMSRQGDVLIVTVVENPIINRIVFEGNKAKDDEDLGEEVQVRPRTVFTRARVQGDVGRILELYRRSGRFGATVTPKIIELPQNRVDLVFEISEGPVTGVDKINFIGNHAFTDRQLMKEIVTRESTIWTFFSSNDNYDPDRVAYDGEKLREYYRRHGYADFAVVSSVAELTPDGKSFIITYTIDEGPQYTFGEISVETTLEEVSPEFLKATLSVREGDLYNAERIDSSIDSITYLAGTAGYAFVDVQPIPDRDVEARTIGLTFEVNEGPRVYIERINIRGNYTTLDRVIRREMRVTEGDAFNKIQIERSRVRIRALGFFEEVEITEEPGTEPDRTILDVEVEERLTGELSVGFGFSSDYFSGDISVSQSNWLGRGQFLRLRLSASDFQQQIDFSFTEPYFLGYPLNAGFDLFHTASDFRDYSGFKSTTTGLGLRTGFPISEFTRLGLNYNIETSDLSIDPIRDPFTGTIISQPCTTTFQLRVSRAICESLGTNLKSEIGYSLYTDRRNDPIEPTRGTSIRLQQSVAGLGGDVKFLRTEVSTSSFKRLWRDDLVLGFYWDAGYIWDYGDEGIRINERFFKGGTSMRGFETSGIGPRDVGVLDPDTGQRVGGTLDALGGTAYGIGSIELRVPTFLPEDYGIKASLFYEMGTLGLLSDEDLAGTREFVEDDLAWRSSAGVTIFWDSPFGPVRFDIAEVLEREYYDQTEQFRFSGGRRF